MKSYMAKLLTHAEIHRGENLLGFKAKGTWSASDLEVFISNITRTYNMILACSHPNLLDQSYKFKSTYHLSRRIERHIRKEEKLLVYRIHIGSPGGYSFIGVPEIIREFKELVRYVKTGRHQDELENKKRCLELVEHWLEIRRKYYEADNITDQKYHIYGQKYDDMSLIIKVLCNGLINLEEFESKGKIDDMLHNFEYLPTYSDPRGKTLTRKQVTKGNPPYKKRI